MKRCIVLAFAAAAALEASAGEIQRRTAQEIEEGARNETGVVTYSVTDDAESAVLHVGTSDVGTVHVTDPYAVHFVTRRTLSSGEYALELSDGAFWAGTGAICLATNVTGSAFVTNTVSVLIADSRMVLQDVTFRLSGNGQVSVVRVSGARIDLVGTTGTGIVGGIGQPGCLTIGDISVLAADTEAGRDVWDSTVDSVTLRDTMGEIAVSGLRRWVADRYDWRTAEDWSNHPATNTIRLGGQRIRFNDSGSITAAFDGQSATNAWSVRAYGSKVLSIVPGFQTSAPAGAFDVVDVAVGGSAFSLWVTSDLGVPVTVQTTASLDSGDWEDAPNQLSTYPETEQRAGRTCYRVDLPLDAAGPAAFYRARCTTSGQAAEIRIDNCQLFIGGIRCIWTNVVVNGSTMRVLAAAE